MMKKKSMERNREREREKQDAATCIIDFNLKMMFAVDGLLCSFFFMVMFSFFIADAYTVWE